MSSKDSKADDETKVIYLDKDYKADDAEDTEAVSAEENKEAKEAEETVVVEPVVETAVEPAVETAVEDDKKDEDNESVATNELISLHPIYIMLDTFLNHGDKSVAQLFSERSADIKELKTEIKSLRAELTAVPEPK